MAITRRQFVTRLGTLATAMGLSQTELSKLSEAFAHGYPWDSALGDKWYTKPKVVWVHGAECTGCSTSFLGFFEDVRGTAVDFGTSKVTTAGALDIISGGAGSSPYDALLAANNRPNHTYAHRTVQKTHSAGASNLDVDGAGASNGAYIANVADVIIDFLDVHYHETVQSAGGPLAYENLKFHKTASTPFVLVVEGAVQPYGDGGAWSEPNTTKPWCGVGMGEAGGANEHEFSELVAALAKNTACVGIVSIGQCACYGGYPGCKNYTQEYNTTSVTGTKKSQTGAKGVYDFLRAYQGDALVTAAANKVVNSPGCPTNPWWFVLTVVAFLTDFVACPRSIGATGPLGVLEATGTGATDMKIRTASVDSGRRIKAIYPYTVHGPHCPRYNSFLEGDFATVQGAKGCLQKIGCKGPATMSSCGPHGWNAQQPQNAQNTSGELEFELARFNETAAGSGTYRGTFCVMAGHPCMACTQKGYPDNFVPFIKR